ncbi:MAG: hypothetical protein M5T61_02275 [Acidimicrobiia bacterium]|nr:hypothetical protein [Acidimicrobiia bacterium]
MVGLGDRPAADLLLAGVDVAVDQLGVPRHGGEEPVEVGYSEAHCEAGVTPPHLLVDDAADDRSGDGIGPRFGRAELIDAELAVLLEDLPERGVGGDDVGGVVELVEALSDGAHHLYGEAVHRVANLDVLFAEAGVVVQQRHGDVPLLIVFPG